MICPLELVEDFIRIADANTLRKIETCAILAGNERKDGTLVIDTLIIPKQHGAHDHCYMTDEMEMFQTQIENNVMTLGWIHTHPQYSLFLSSVDLHNQLGYQL
jgi:STAM-binding protein